MTSYEPITSGRLYEKIAQQIEQAVLTGKLSAGDRLPSEKELGEQFRVSRTAVREAVKALREKGLVEVYPGRGTFISNISDGMSKAVRDSLDRLMRVGTQEGSRDLVEIRSMLEPEIAALAAIRATDVHIAALHKAVEEMDEAERADNVDRFVEADNEFHFTLADASQNALVPTLINPIMDILQEQRKRIALVEGGLKRGQKHHKRILGAIQKRDPDLARKAMLAHLLQVQEDSQASLEF